MRRLMPEAQATAQAAQAAHQAAAKAADGGGEEAAAGAARAAQVAKGAALALEERFWRALQGELLATFQRTQKHLYFIVTAPTVGAVTAEGGGGGEGGSDGGNAGGGGGGGGGARPSAVAASLHWDRVHALVHAISQAWTAAQTKAYDVRAVPGVCASCLCCVCVRTCCSQT